MVPESLVIARRFNGPPDSGNGGYVAGRLGRLFDGSAEVTLRAAVPIETPLALVRANGHVDLRDGEDLIASVTAKPLALDVPASPVDFATAEKLSALGGSGEDSAYNTCFVCGRGRHDGLRVFCSAVDGAGGIHAGAWVPDASLEGARGKVAPEFLWGALDCPGGTAACEGEALTGRMHGIADAELSIGEKCIVLAWPVAAEGRKRFAGTAVLDSRGRVRAKALSTWIMPK
jgi:hypothetical protein